MKSNKSMFLRQGRQDVKRKAISDPVLCQSEMEGGGRKGSR